MMIVARLSLLSAVLLISCDLAAAARINWATVQATTADAAEDVVDGGNVVLAINGRSQTDSSSRRPPSTVTLDGVVFESAPIADFLGRTAIDVPHALSSPKSTGDSEYDAFLTHVAFTNVSVAELRGTDSNAIYPIRGLTVGTDYLIQLWYTDERPSVFPNAQSRIAIFGDNEPIENTVVVPGEGANGYGSFVAGSFEADRRSQNLRLAITNTARSHLTGILVREALPCTPSLGDIDQDGVVQFSDFLILSRGFGFVGGEADGDLDCNAIVDFVDFLNLSRSYGQTVAFVQAVPEPSGLTGMSILMFCCCWFRRR